MKRVVVLGLMGQYPMGGMGWQVLHHLIGFRQLGCEAFYVENSGAPPYSPRLSSVAQDARENVRFLATTLQRFGLSDNWAYYDCLTDEWMGMGEARALDLLDHADLIVNLCGATRPERHWRRRGCLLYMQTDPAFDQINLANGDPETRAFVDDHDLHFTYGWNIGEPGCSVPTGGVDWRKTHPPVIVALWRFPSRRRGPWRTIATYQNRGKDILFDGETYLWSKHPSFERVLDLPARTREKLELALVVDDERVRERLVQNGWSLRDPYPVSRSVASYQSYIRGAKGEFSVEKDNYVRLRTGWFSDRTVCFLAAGRPCVVENTGFGARLPTDAGLLAWTTAEEAGEALDRVGRDYALHAAAARGLAREFFEARALLAPILQAAGL